MNKKLKWCFGIVSVILISIIILAPLKVFSFWSFSTKFSDWGSFGDYLSGTLGLFVAITTIVLVYLTYKAQVDFSNRQVEHLTKSEKAFNKQIDISTRTSTYEIFFNLLTKKDIRLSGIKYVPKSLLNKSEKVQQENSLTGEDAIVMMLNDTLEIIERDNRNVASHVKKFDARKQTLLRSVDYVVPFINFIYNILKFIESSSLEKVEKQILATYLRDSLSASEVFLYMVFTNKPERFNSPKLQDTTQMFGLASKYKMFEYVKDTNVDLFIVE